jgi:hypothetical protein
MNVENINGDRLLELDQLPENLADGTQQIAKSCGVGSNQFAIAGWGWFTRKFLAKSARSNCLAGFKINGDRCKQV